MADFEDIDDMEYERQIRERELRKLQSAHEKISPQFRLLQNAMHHNFTIFKINNI